MTGHPVSACFFAFFLTSFTQDRPPFQLEERRETDPHISLSNLTSNLDEQRKPKFERSSSVESDRSPLLLPAQPAKPPSRPSSALSGGEGRKFSLPANINAHLMAMDDGPETEEAVGAIRDTIEGHATRSKSLSILRTSGGRIHIARPWLKKKAGATDADGSAGVTEESSGEFMRFWGLFFETRSLNLLNTVEIL